MKSINKIIHLKFLYIFFVILSLNIFFFSTTKVEGKPFEVKEIKFKIDQVRQYMGSDSIENIPTEDYMWSFRRKT